MTASEASKTWFDEVVQYMLDTWQEIAMNKQSIKQSEYRKAGSPRLSATASIVP